MTTFHFLQLSNYPIFDQLLLEEALLRSDERNWCIVNTGSPRAIVMGISGKTEELINCDKAIRDQVPIIRRFSGGGTVVVDENTLFVTFICQKQIHDFPAYPEPIMRWSEGIYRDVFNRPDFQLRENDYVLGELKCGGNAQYIKKNRWLHHTSFLWDYMPENMDYLLHPKKAPAYREGRLHNDFLCRISPHFSHQEEWIQKLKNSLQNRYGLIEAQIESVLALESRQATCFVPLNYTAST